MRAKRESGSHPYVLVLGAGASLSSGTSLNRSVVERIVGAFDPQAFDAYLAQCSDDERFAILRDLVEGASPSIGYRALAELIRAGYFDVILSTNYDPLLEDAIVGLDMRRRDYLFLVHGVMDPDFIADHLDNPVPRIKLLKLHGDLFYQRFFYTGDEIERFPPPIQRALEIYLNHRDFLIVGHSMRDSDINRCLTEKGSSIWHAGPRPPSEEIARLMRLRRSEHNFISGDGGQFDSFFSHLRDALLGGTAAVNVDQIAQSIFKVGLEGDEPSGSGFLLGDSGLVVTDSSVLRGLAYRAGLKDIPDPGFKAWVQPFNAGPGRQAELRVTPEKALDYAVFKLQDPLEISPLRLADDLPALDAPVTACISVGEAHGFHDGKVTGVNRSVPITGMPGGSETVGDLIETDIMTREGASGAPLVGKDGLVIGMIVAGRLGENQSFALSSLRLEAMLGGAGLG